MISLRDLLAAPGPMFMLAFCTDVPVITRSNRFSKHLLVHCERLAGLIAAWPECCPAPKDCCDRDSGLRRRQFDVSEESCGLPGIPVPRDFQPARGGTGGQNNVTRGRAFLGDVEPRGTRFEHDRARRNLAEYSASRHLPRNAMDVRVFGRSPWCSRIGFVAWVLPTFCRSSQGASRGLEPVAGA